MRALDIFIFWFRSGMFLNNILKDSTLFILLKHTAVAFLSYFSIAFPIELFIWHDRIGHRFAPVSRNVKWFSAQTPLKYLL